MNRIYSNQPSGGFVKYLFKQLCDASNQLDLATPYFTEPELVLEAATRGKTVRLLVGLNAITRPESLRKLHGVSNISIRYLTNLFHAKIYIFDDVALLGSSNLTDNGLVRNREAVICLKQSEDPLAVEELRELFSELWDWGLVLTTEKLETFATAYTAARARAYDPDTDIEKAIGRAEPPSVRAGSRKKTREHLHLEPLRRQVYEQYRPAFEEVDSILNEKELRRPELSKLGRPYETNRFLNWVRLTHAAGDNAWESVPLRAPEGRKAETIRIGREWKATENNRVSDDFLDRLRTVTQVFYTVKSVEAASKDQIMNGLMAIHAFSEQHRFVDGGLKNLPNEFWSLNGHDVARVKVTLNHLLYGTGEFVQRLHDILNKPAMKLKLFGRFSALELYGTLRPYECPPVNGRIAKALRYLGFDVRTQ